MQLPSNKIGLLLVLVVLIVVGTITGNIFVDELSKKDQPEEEKVAVTIERRTTNAGSVDLDGDGLFAWQESLYGSDPNNPDTDGDGTNDGDEIKEGRDPKVAGPDDTLSSYQDLFQSEANFENYKQNSLTDNLSVELFANYLQLKQSNALQQENQTALVEGIANKADQSTDISNQYGLSDLNITVSSSEDLKSYGTNFANLYLGYLNRLNSIGGEDDLKYINEVSVGYKELAEALLRLPVPDVAKNVHLEIVNRINNAGILLGQFADNYEEDPLKSLFAIQNIQLNSENDRALYNSLAIYFRDNGIIFDSNEVIRFWNFYE